MTDAQVLFVALGILYLWECLVWVPRGTVVFRRFGPRRAARVHDGSRLPGPHVAGLLFSDPLPSFGLAAVTAWLPVSLSIRGVYSYVAFAFNPGGRHDQVERWEPFDHIRSIAVRERDVLVNDTLFVRAASPALAAHLAALVRDLRGRPEAERAARIEAEIERSFDDGAVRDLLARYDREAAPIRRLGAILLLHLFVVLPVVLWLRGLIATWPWLLGSTLALAAIVAWRYWVAHARLDPAGGVDRWGSAVAMVLCPPLAARAAVLLSRDRFALHHPLAVGAVLCDAADAGRLAAGLLLDARCPVAPPCPAEDPGAREAEGWYRDRVLRAMEGFVARTRGSADDLLSRVVPERDGRACCPRCRVQYRSTEGVCADCGGLLLQPIHGGAQHVDKE
jgi:hypothetical protein